MRFKYIILVTAPFLIVGLIAYNRFVIHTFNAELWGSDSDYSSIFIKDIFPTFGESRGFFAGKTVRYTSDQPGYPASCDFYDENGKYYHLWAGTEQIGNWSVEEKILPIWHHGHYTFRLIPMLCRNLADFEIDNCAYMMRLKNIVPMDEPPLQGDACGFSKKSPP